MSNQLLYQCVVLDNEDPLMLGRVRARLLTDNYSDMLKSFDNPPWNPQKDPWSTRDPFIFNPLLPYFLYQVPKVEELIYILYYNNDFKYRNQFYVQAMFSSPTTSPFEYYVGAQKFTGVGVQFTNPLPIKNQDGTYANNLSKGVFPEPGDNALLGRGNADVIVKENGVLIRTNKIKGNLRQNTLPVGNDRGGFLQLTKFDINKTYDSTKNFTELDEDVVMTNYVIEYQIINPENTQNKYSGYVYLYKLKPDLRVNSQNMKVDSEIEDLKSLVLVQEFRALGFDDTVNFINQTIYLFNSKNKIDGRVIFNPISKFPIYYRPTPSMYSLISSNVNQSTDKISYKLVNDVFNKIRLNSSTKKFGYELIYAENKLGVPFKIKKSSQDVYKFNKTPVTMGSFGADKIFLLSQKSEIPGKGGINFDGTLYGITNEQYVQEIIPKTSSMVRGEELMQLINIIVRFLTSHTHSFPGLPPVPIAYDGSSTTGMLTELQNAANKILNENIRIN
jgi:hypothetical protein